MEKSSHLNSLSLCWYILYIQENLCQKLFFLQNMLCTKIVLNVRNNFCTQHGLPRFELGIFMHWTCNLMNNLSSYCGLIDSKIRASDKDLPVTIAQMLFTYYELFCFLNQQIWSKYIKLSPKIQILITYYQF